jgi:hypothetical protein
MSSRLRNEQSPRRRQRSPNPWDGVGPRQISRALPRMRRSKSARFLETKIEQKVENMGCLFSSLDLNSLNSMVKIMEMVDTTGIEPVTLRV